MKSLALFSTLLAVSAARKCIVQPSAEQSDVEINDSTMAVEESDAEINDSTMAAEDSDAELPNLDDPVDSGDEKVKLPANFIWGGATAAYQVEGGWNADGRGESVWDHFTHVYSHNVESGDRSIPFSTNGDVASNSYYQFEDDVAMMKIMNSKYYRFSMSWSRIFPKGVAKDENGNWLVNEKGAAYYDYVIDTLLENNIMPFLTLYHWDLPYALHEKYGGWLDYRSQDDYADYAEYCFQRYGDRVKNWITINEPWVNCVLGYKSGPQKAPYRCTSEMPRKLQANQTGLDLEGGCSFEIGPSQYYPGAEILPKDRAPQRLEDVWCSHNILLGHAKAVKRYREKFQATQKGLIGITVDGETQVPWIEPGMSDEEVAHNEEYANLATEFRIGWYIDPPMVGDYPESVKQRMGKDMPVFTEEEKAMLKGSSDFIGWNTYTAHWAAQAKDANGTLIEPPTAEEANYENSRRDIWEDNCLHRGEGNKCIPPTLGTQTGSGWNIKYAPGIRVGLKWFSERFEGLIKNGIVITENGCAQPNYKVSRAKDEVTLEYFKSIGQEELAGYYDESVIEHEGELDGPLIHDEFRIGWYRDYLENVRLAYAEDGRDIRGFLAWSLVDNFEWENGYETRFGMTYIDFYKDPEMKRHPKDSLYFLGQWYLDNVEQE